MFEDFTTIDYILSYPGMIITIILLTQFSKKMLDNIRTKYVALGIAVGLSILAAIVQGDFTSPMFIVQTIVTWIVNCVIVWMAAMKSFETVAETGPVVVNIPSNGDMDNELYKTAFEAAKLHLDEFKDVRLKRIQEYPE